MQPGPHSWPDYAARFVTFLFLSFRSYNQMLFLPQIVWSQALATASRIQMDNTQKIKNKTFLN